MTDFRFLMQNIMLLILCTCSEMCLLAIFCLALLSNAKKHAENVTTETVTTVTF